MGESQLNRHQFLRDLVEEQSRNQMILEMVNSDEVSDPWAYSEPPPPPLTVETSPAWAQFIADSLEGAAL